MREGFKETFQPLIASQEAVKTSIDKQQNKLIEQLQENQLALTEGLNKNRLAITSGFDKMDEVKKWDLQQLPGLEAIEEPEDYKEEEPEDLSEEYGEEPKYLISLNDIRRIEGKERRIKEKDEELINIKKSYLDDLLSRGNFNKDKYTLIFFDRNKSILKAVEKNLGKEPKKRIVTFTDSDLDENLMNKKSKIYCIFIVLRRSFKRKYKDFN